MTRSHSQLGLEQLEDRLVPTSFASFWHSFAALPLRFEADSIQASGTAGNSPENGDSQVMGTTARQITILQAFRAWEATSNTRIAIVADGGDSLSPPLADHGDASLATSGGADLSAQSGGVGQGTTEQAGPDANGLANDQTGGASTGILSSNVDNLTSRMWNMISHPHNRHGFGAAHTTAAPDSTGANQGHDIQLVIGPLLTDTDTIPNYSIIPDFLWTGQSFKANIPISPLSPAVYT